MSIEVNLKNLLLTFNHCSITEVTRHNQQCCTGSKSELGHHMHAH